MVTIIQRSKIASLRCMRVFLASPTAIVLICAPLLAQRPSTVFQGKRVVANEIIVRLGSNAPLSRIAGAAASGEVLKPIGNGLGLHLLHSDTRDVAALLSAFSRDPNVLYAEPNYILTANAVPNDASWPQLWGLQQIFAPAAWNITTGSTTYVAGVVDTGIDYTHPDLAANVWTAPSSFTVNINGASITCPAGSHGFNAIALSCDPMDDNNHGTHVSGTIGAVGNNSLGVAGVNWNARVMGLKFLDSTGSGAISDAINAIEFAIQVKALFPSAANVRVLSNSYGGGSYSQAFLDEINRAGASEILFVAAAGNSSTNDDLARFYPAAYNAPNEIAVAATDGADSLASFSNYGASTVQLGAPGVSILSTVRGGGYAYFSGTSMATPHVSGAVLLTLAACPSLNTAAVRSAILNGVDKVNALAGKTATGGRLNVANAIQSCAAVSQPPPPANAVNIWPNAVAPALPFWADSPVELGVKFRSDVAGVITGIRFYKGSAAITGVHTGSLWSSTGALLATGTFTNETASGWQQMTFSNPVPIAANTTYIASYHTNTGFSVDVGYFVSQGTGNGPLHALQSGVDGANGVFIYGPGGQFPSYGSSGQNYWVDVAFVPSTGSLPTTIWSNSASPSIPLYLDSPVELGVKFRSDVAGSITGIRFYKAPGNTGAHTGSLWTSTGTLLATGTFTNETASGWQQMTFATPVPIAANTTYIASYHTNTGFSVDIFYFVSHGVDNAPLHALQHGIDGANGVFVYGPGGQFPINGSNGHNYWVDVMFTH
jgi:subtilisin family serine protease